MVSRTSQQKAEAVKSGWKRTWLIWTTRGHLIIKAWGTEKQQMRFQGLLALPPLRLPFFDYNKPFLWSVVSVHENITSCWHWNDYECTKMNHSHECVFILLVMLHYKKNEKWGGNGTETGESIHWESWKKLSLVLCTYYSCGAESWRPDNCSS